MASPMSPVRAEARRRNPGMDDHMAQTPPHSAPATPRSTLGSPLTTHASRRSGVGDLAAGPRRRNSLSEVEILPWVCCMTPALCVFGLYGTLVVTSIFFETCFYVVTAGLTCICVVWVSNMAIASLVGAHKVRKATATDWHARLLQVQEVDPEGSSCLHVVILPNYRENERMLKETLDNIGNSPLAPTRIRVVLAMEAREGPAGHEKAERLIQQTSHLFADIFATYHPENLPGEVAGKSSNTQWAYRAALARYAGQLSKRDPARVFISVGDADTLWNPQYFDAMTYQALKMPQDEAAWAIWQPPMLLFRNLFAVPGFTRLAGYGTLLFELAGLANQRFGAAFCFSSYSMTLALASHRMVGGWDTDVIAEDHHMFCKCFFGSLWEDAERTDKSLKIEPKVQLCPVYLPAEGYLVESDGYVQSCLARFQQARRHSQGIAELGYALLQYVRLLAACGPSRLARSAHAQILAIIWKMMTVHIINNVQAVALLIAMQFAALEIIKGFRSAGITGALTEALALSGAGAAGFSSLELARQALAATFGPAPPIGMLSAAAIYVVMRDVIEGRYTRGPEASQDAAEADGAPMRLTCWQKLRLVVQSQTDMLVLAEPTILLYGMVPSVLAAWSLFTRGMQFEYIVAEKKPGES
eukprot:CAMPEP_0168403798 /NCGR_PEP_ID=MMETSP0228-20121227/24313_1 /TAXON_ID=133427 /ORGANISM="Protoceratium reticulatum, Strain CCCM 535 (=CCMP 1889)" /LENGTH=642 /DNA_ID=CAMNT_0008417409 /DNA_START=29 /DNA_END=1957 /DNA_ORIENTATION=+